MDYKLHIAQFNVEPSYEWSVTVYALCGTVKALYGTIILFPDTLYDTSDTFFHNCRF
jgi:hypothetical protein